MSISLDHDKAKKILCAVARDAVSPTKDPLVNDWIEKVNRLGKLCPPRKSATTIAALGIALLAKSVNSRIDAYSLLSRGDGDKSYSARALGDVVWAKCRAQIGVDLGANGPNPLNNTPFIGKTRIDEITGVRNKEGWKCFLKCIADANGLTAADAKKALRGFIVSRTLEIVQTIEITPEEGNDIPAARLLNAIDEFVAEKSEGGRRAQASASAILDATFGSDRVGVGKVNDPDRRLPLDVSVKSKDSEEFEFAIEVRDKTLEESGVIASIEKTCRDFGPLKFGFLAVAKNQSTMADTVEAIEWANKRGVRFVVFESWRQLYDTCKFISEEEGVFEGMVFRQILERASQLGVSQKCLNSFREKLLS